MNRTKTLALCGVSGALALVALVVTTFVPYVAFVMGTLASVAVALPVLANDKLKYGLLTYLSTAILSVVFASFVNNAYLIVFVTVFAMPFAVLKAYFDGNKAKTTVAPFDGQTTMTLLPKRRVKRIVAYIVYYALLETALALSVLFMTWLQPNLFENVVASRFLWLVLALAQITVPIFDFILTGCFAVARKTLNKTRK